MKSKKSEKPVTSKPKKRKDAVIFEKILDYGKKIIKEEYQFISDLSYYRDMEQKFGEENLTLIMESWQKLTFELTTIEMFGFDVNEFLMEINSYNRIPKKKKLLANQQEVIQNILLEIDRLLVFINYAQRMNFPNEIVLININEAISKIKNFKLKDICLYLKKMSESTNDLVQFLTELNEEFQIYLNRITYNLDTFSDNSRNAIIINDKIIWNGSLEQLIQLFKKLCEGGFLPVYTEEEILLHFVNDKLQPFIDSNVDNNLLIFHWKGRDVEFSDLIQLLTERKFIPSSKKFHLMKDHFLNEFGNSFKNLPQKQNKRSFQDKNYLISSIISEL